MVRQRYMIFTLVFVMFFAPISFGDGVIPGGEDPGDPGQAPVPVIQIFATNGKTQPMPYQVSAGTPFDFYHTRVFRVQLNGTLTPMGIHSSGTLDSQGNQAGNYPPPHPTWGGNVTYRAQWYNPANNQNIAWSNPVTF